MTTDDDCTLRPCGTVRPGTLGYQRCVLPDGHDGPHKSQDSQRYDIHDDGKGYTLR